MSSSTKLRSGRPSSSVTSMRTSGAIALLLPPVFELLPGLALAREAPQGEAGRQGRLEGDVDLAEPGGMGEEEGVGLATLAAAGRRPAGDDRLALTGGPEMVRGRAAFAVGAAAAGEPELRQPVAPVAERPRGRLRVDLGELVLGHHPVGGEEVQDVKIEVGKRWGPIRAGSRSGHRQRSSRQEAAERASARAPASDRPSRRHVAAGWRRRRTPWPTISAAPSARRYGAGRPWPGSRRGAVASPAPKRSRSRRVRSEQPKVRGADRSEKEKRRAERSGETVASRCAAGDARGDRSATRWTPTGRVETRARGRWEHLAACRGVRGGRPCLSGSDRLARSA